MSNYKFLLIAFLLFACLAINGQDNSLTVTNEEGKVTKITAEEIGKLKRQSVKANDHGVSANFEGVLLADILQLGGVKFGETMSGKRLALSLLFEAANKYQVVFALSELDAGFTDKIILLADKRDGQPLSEKEGNYRIISPDEKRQGRWVRQVVSFKVVNLASTNK